MTEAQEALLSLLADAVAALADDAGKAADAQDIRDQAVRVDAEKATP